MLAPLSVVPLSVAPLPVGPLHHFGVVYLIDLRVSDDPHFVYRPVMQLGKLVAGVCSLPGEVVARGPVG